MEPIIRHIKNIDAIPDVCGELRVLSTAEDFKKANVVMAEMRGPSVPHYHKVLTEFYFIMSGCGKLLVTNNIFEIQYRSLVIIPPHHAHSAIPRKKLTVLAFSVPAWTEEDEFVIEEESMAGYNMLIEKCALLDELFCRESLAIKKKMSDKEVEKVEEERRRLLLENHWNHMKVSELRQLLEV